MFLSSKLGLTLALNKGIEEKVLAIEHGIGELRNPVAEDKHPTGALEHQVELNVAMAEDEEVDVGVRAEVVLGKDDEFLAVLTLIGRFLAVFAFHTTVACPFQAEGHAPAGMDAGEEALAQAIVEDAAQEFELAVLAAQPFAMAQVEEAAVDIHHAALRVERDATFFLQVVAHPQVVVAREEMHLHAHVRQLAYLAQQAGVTLGHHGLVLVPEVKDVAEQIDGGGFVLDAVEEVHQPALLHTRMGYG